MTIGIYSLYFDKGKETDVYVGQSTNIERRYNWEHLPRLKSEKHENSKLQKAHTLYGLPSMIILEECILEALNIKEMYWISELDSFNNGLNLSIGGTGYASGHLHPDALHNHTTYYEILLNLSKGLSSQEVANLLGVSIYIVRGIRRKEKHTYLKDLYPAIYDLATNTVQKRGPKTKKPLNTNI